MDSAPTAPAIPGKHAVPFRDGAIRPLAEAAVLTALQSAQHPERFEARKDTLLKGLAMELLLAEIPSVPPSFSKIIGMYHISEEVAYLNIETERNAYERNQSCNNRTAPDPTGASAKTTFASAIRRGARNGKEQERWEHLCVAPRGRRRRPRRRFLPLLRQSSCGTGEQSPGRRMVRPVRLLRCEAGAQQRSSRHSGAEPGIPARNGRAVALRDSGRCLICPRHTLRTGSGFRKKKTGS